jgi:hypothetical protein
MPLKCFAAIELRLKGAATMDREQKKLDDLLEAGKTVVEIAPELHRNRHAVLLTKPAFSARSPDMEWHPDDEP